MDLLAKLHRDYLVINAAIKRYNDCLDGEFDRLEATWPNVPPDFLKPENIHDLEIMPPTQLLTLDQRRYVSDPTGELHRAARHLDAFNATTLTLALVTLALLLGMGLAGWFNGITAQ
jgi:hypothetical protein